MVTKSGADKEAEEKKPRSTKPEDNLGLIRTALAQIREPYDPQIREDLIQQGYFGLHKASQRFNPELGNAFSSYAVALIKGEIRHYLRDRSHSVRLPRHIDKNIRARFHVDSLDRRLRAGADELGCTLGELTADPRGVQDEQLMELRGAMQNINPNNAAILRLTIAGGDMTYADAAKILGCSLVTASRRAKRGVTELKKLCG